MKLLLDQNLSAEAAPILRSRGMDAIHTREVGLETTEDDAILAWCRTEARIIITLDADFHALLALTGARTPSVVRIRIEGLRDEGLATLILRVVALTEADLQLGAVVTVTETSVRVRRLPLVRSTH
jgi:predicted nuclease of predicted toxin-antitoxin system